MNYKLEISEEHAEVIIKALDLYSRIGMGQINEIATIYRYDNRKARDHQDKETLPIDWDELESLLRKVKVVLGHHPGGNWGIFNHEVPDNYRTAWDIQKVIRHRLAWDKHPEGGITVDFYGPSQSSRLPLPKIEKMEKEN